MQLWGLLCAVVDVGWSQGSGRLRILRPTINTTTHDSHQSCIRVVSPDDGQVIPKYKVIVKVKCIMLVVFIT
jgi:hypothetical protein